MNKFTLCNPRPTLSDAPQRSVRSVAAVMTFAIAVSVAEINCWKQQTTHSDNAVVYYPDISLTNNQAEKAAYLSRLTSFCKLPANWDGQEALPLEKASYTNAHQVIDALDSRDLVKWNIFPAANGTLLMTLQRKAIATLNIGNQDMSFVAARLDGTTLLEGIEDFSVARAIDIISEIQQLFTDEKGGCA